ncbi:MAG: prepilin-type N-terminal cleavage/methylation domain-containing protein [Candidatus Paceibacterota bacterium]|jgi:type IV pilus assembly protein PilA
MRIISRNLTRGFTLLEVLLVVAIIAILAGIVIVAINPTKQLGDARNAQRKSDVATILSAVYQYSMDHNGRLPGARITAIGSSCTSPVTLVNEICKAVNDACVSTDTAIDLDYYLASTTQPYLSAIPHDPSVSDYTANGTNYFIGTTTGNRITVCAPGAENGITISVTR